MRAIDVHCHPSTKEHSVSVGKYMAALEAMLGRPMRSKTDDVFAMLIAMDAQAETGEGVITNDYIAGLTTRYPDVFLPGWARGRESSLWRSWNVPSATSSSPAPSGCPSCRASTRTIIASIRSGICASRWGHRC